MSGAIAASFERAAAENRAAFIAYLTAGYPSLEQFEETALTILEHADMLEIGLPFSDPLGDGPTVQRAGERALANGVDGRLTVELVARLRRRSDKPLLVMSYYNPIFCYPGGEEGFVTDLAAAGGDGVILPDLPPDEGASLIAHARRAELDTVFLVAPTSTSARLALVAAASTGFVYAVSVTGVTGARDAFPTEVADLVARTRAAGAARVAVGFGVKNRATANRIAGFADGVVVGSALLNAIESGEDVAAFAAELAAGCRR